MKPCIQCGVLTPGKYCQTCRRYFKSGGIIHPLPKQGEVVYTSNQRSNAIFKMVLRALSR